MRKQIKNKMCVICGKKKAANIPLTNGTPIYINAGACDKSICILTRMRQTG